VGGKAHPTNLRRPMKHSLIEISLSGLDDQLLRSVVDLFDQWGRGGAVVEQVLEKDAGPSIKTYLLPEDDEGLCQIEIGLELLNRSRRPSRPGNLISTRDVPEPRIRFLSETDWSEAWKSNYNVLRVGRRLVIKPTWRDYTPHPGDLIIALDPGMAFGSGLHPTTRLCLEAMEDYLHPGATVLDVGTGSGILAIAAARLGASYVLALDTDPLAAQVARENIALNKVESIVHVEAEALRLSNNKSANRKASELRSQASSKPQSPISDLVLANILAETIIELAPALADSLAPRGTLIASGIIADRADAVITGLRRGGLSLAEQRSQEEWVALIAGKVERK
jgi:ribosomal protein L11 methyltransferase